MDELIRDHLPTLVVIIAIVVAGVLGGLYKIGWIKFSQKKEVWDGEERRECAHHPALSQKVCSLYAKMDDIDKKLDSVSEKLQFVLGRLESRWGKTIGDGY